MKQELSAARWLVGVACAAMALAASLLVACSASRTSAMEPTDGEEQGDADIAVEASSFDAGLDAAQIFVAPSESMYATDGGTVHMVCKGSGALPVVFLAGGNNDYTIWDNLIACLGPHVLTCAFDRPGIPPSYVPTTPWTPQVIADALAETLAQAKIGSRFLLVGHSLGGISIRVFGASYPDRVGGAVLFDPTVPVFARLTDDGGGFMQLGCDPAAVEDQGNAVTKWMSPAKVTVLSHDPDSGTLDTAAEQDLWEQGQRDYAALTPNGTQNDVPGAGHYVFIDKQAVAMVAIQKLLAAH